jgi:hypothetical protein
VVVFDLQCRISWRRRKWTWIPCCCGLFNWSGGAGLWYPPPLLSLWSWSRGSQRINTYVLYNSISHPTNILLHCLQTNTGGSSLVHNFLISDQHHPNEWETAQDGCMYACISRYQSKQIPSVVISSLHTYIHTYIHTHVIQLPPPHSVLCALCSFFGSMRSGFIPAEEEEEEEVKQAGKQSTTSFLPFEYSVRSTP